MKASEDPLAVVAVTPEEQRPEEQRPEPHNKGKVYKSTCFHPGCGFKTNKMKRHVVRQHICNGPWWFLLPLLSCWVCRKWEIVNHCRIHGPFDTNRHLPQLAHLVDGFIYHICNTLHVVSSEDLLQFICCRERGDRIAEFSAEEIEVWDAYDNFICLPKLHNRCIISPSRLSSVFHWQTLQQLLSLVPPPPLELPFPQESPLPPDLQLAVCPPINNAVIYFSRATPSSGVSRSSSSTGVSIVLL